MRRVFSVLALILLIACQVEPDRPVEIDFWAMGQEGEWVKALLPEFERLYPGIVVKVQRIPWGAAHEKLLTAYAGDSMPDLFQIGNTYIPEMVALKALAPLNGWASDLPLDDFFPGILATNRLGSELYAIPWYVDTRVLFYRKDLLAQAGWTIPPKTWPDWLEAMRSIKKNHPFALLLPVDDWRLLAILGLQQGHSLLKDCDRFGDFNSDSFKLAFDFYLNFFKQGLAPNFSESEVANLYQEFGQGLFSIYITGPWNLTEFRRRVPESIPWGTAPLPGASLAGGASLAVSNSSKHKQEAWKLIEFLAEPIRQLAFYRLTGDLPARRSAWNDDALKNDEKLDAFKTQLDDWVATPKIPEWEHIAAQMARYAERVVRNEISAEDALFELNKKVDSILEKRRWLMHRSEKNISQD